MPLNYKSSKTQRRVQRVNAGAEIVHGTLREILPAVSVPVKVSQCCASLFAPTRKETKCSERAINLLQAAITAAQTGLLCYMSYDDTKCSDTTGTICTSYFVLEWVYRGLLLSSWAASELVKDQQPPTPQNTRANSADDGNDYVSNDVQDEIKL
jgi:hypothetical protein